METKLEEDSARVRAKREQILAGAQRVFLHEGFAAASTDTLAREAGVSKRTLYAYYPSKEELFADVLRTLTIEHPQLRILDFIRGIEPHSSDELRIALIKLAGKALSVLMNPEYLALMRTIIADSHRFPQLAELVRSTVPEIALREVGAMLQRAQTNGIAIQSDPDILARLFIGPLLSYVLLDGLLRPESQLPSLEKIEEIVDLVMKALLKDA
jgi:AcrR family transcriptional regulator